MRIIKSGRQVSMSERRRHSDGRRCAHTDQSPAARCCCFRQLQRRPSPPVRCCPPGMTHSRFLNWRGCQRCLAIPDVSALFHRGLCLSRILSEARGSLRPVVWRLVKMRLSRSLMTAAPPVRAAMPISSLRRRPVALTILTASLWPRRHASGGFIFPMMERRCTPAIFRPARR